MGSVAQHSFVLFNQPDLTHLRGPPLHQLKSRDLYRSRPDSEVEQVGTRKGPLRLNEPDAAVVVAPPSTSRMHYLRHQPPHVCSYMQTRLFNNCMDLWFMP